MDVPLEVQTVADAAPVQEKGVNVSFGGLAFTADGCLANGEIVHLRIPTVQPPFEARARVAWCRPEGTKFLIGAQFLDSAAAFQARMVQQVCSIENYRKEIAEREGRTLTTQEAAAEWIERFAGRFPDSQTTHADESAA